MKVGLAVVGGLVLFAVASVALWQTVGGLVDQAGARAERAVVLDIRFLLTDGQARPIPDAQVRLIVDSDPTAEPTSAGQRFVTDANGLHTRTMNATLNKVQRKRPATLVGSLFSDPELTDHLSLGVELSDRTSRWMYVAQLYRFPSGDLVRDGVTLYVRDGEGRYWRRAVHDGAAWKIADMDPMPVTPGHEMTRYALDRKANTDDWTLSVTFARLPAAMKN